MRHYCGRNIARRFRIVLAIYTDKKLSRYVDEMEIFEKNDNLKPLKSVCEFLSGD